VPKYDDRPETFAFLVRNPDGPLEWPVRVAFGREETARQVAIGPALNGRRHFLGADAKELLTHLRAGGELRVDYLLCNGVKGRAILGQQYFAQSVAMFDACVATNP